MTLWLLAAIAIAVGLMTLWAVEEVQKAADERAQVEDEAAMLSLRESVLYLAATRETTLAGLSPSGLGDAERAIRRMDEFGAFRKDPRGDELRLDGRAYLAAGGIRFALQDEAGLFSMVLPMPASLDRFLASQGVPAGRIPALRDAFLDYIDPDDLEHLEGMEAEGYRRTGRPGPANRFLLAPAELPTVAGWDALPEAQQRALVSRITPYYAGAVNMNAVPEELLPAWLPGCPSSCLALVAQRDRAVFRDSYDLEARTGVQLPGDDAADYRYSPSDVFSLTLWGRSGSARRMHVRLTPLADKTGPWTVLAAYPVPRPSDELPTHVPESDLLADPAAGGRARDGAPARRPAGPDGMGRATREAAVPSS